MKCSLGISNFLEEISSLSHSFVFLYFFALITEEVFLIFLCYCWNSAFKWIYLTFSPLSFASLFFSAMCKASSDNPFAVLHFLFLGIVLVTASCTILQTSVPSSLGTLSIRSNSFICHFHCIIIRDLIKVIPECLVVFPTFFSLNLSLSIRSSCSELQSAPGVDFADCIELLHLWMQRI